MRSTSEILMFSTHEIFTKKKLIFFLFYTFYKLHAVSHPLNKEVLKMQKRKVLVNPNNFGTKIFVTF